MRLSDPQVDVVVLTRDEEPLMAAVAEGIHRQQGVRPLVHRVIGNAQPSDTCRWDTICRARNTGKQLGRSPWLMFLDDDVVMAPDCLSTLLGELINRPNWAAVAADYLGERTLRGPARHVAMGAALFRRRALSDIRFTWRGKRCECQCCCDDLRSRRLVIDYSATARASHLLKEGKSHRSHLDHAPVELQSVDRQVELHSGASGRLPSVCLIVCYWGKLPSWLDYYLLSCAYNPTIDFLIVTDQADHPTPPKNVRFKNINRNDFIALATNKSGAKCRVDKPYKLADYKPLYGQLFEELIEGWDYWGYSDLDVVFGDIRFALNRLRLREYDILTARREFLVGHFTLLRNSPEMRTLYRQSRDFRSTLEQPNVQSFDECGWQWKRRFQGKPLTDSAACDSMSHVVGRLLAEGKIRASFTHEVLECPEVVGNRWKLSWDSGRLHQAENDCEAMYFHFHGFKKSPGFQFARELGDTLAFDIDQAGFHPQPGRVPVASGAAELQLIVPS